MICCGATYCELFSWVSLGHRTVNEKYFCISGHNTEKAFQLPFEKCSASTQQHFDDMVKT